MDAYLCKKGFRLGGYLQHVQFTVRVDIDAFAGHFFSIISSVKNGYQFMSVSTAEFPV